MNRDSPARLRSLCIFCGSSTGNDPVHRHSAARLGRRLAEEGVALVYGGGHMGMMGAVAEAALTNGGRVVGVIPEHLTHIEQAYLEITELLVVEDMHTRKRRMFDMSDAFCVLPGGMGTMDETFEILTWKQLRLHNKPIILVNNDGYWTPLLTLFGTIIGNGFASPETERLYTVVDTIDDVLPAARKELAAAVGGEPQLF